MEARVKEPLCQAPFAPQTIQKGPPDMHNCSVDPLLYLEFFWVQSSLLRLLSLLSLSLSLSHQLLFLVWSHPLYTNSLSLQSNKQPINRQITCKSWESSYSFRNRGILKEHRDKNFHFTHLRALSHILENIIHLSSNHKMYQYGTFWGRWRN